MFFTFGLLLCFPLLFVFLMATSADTLSTPQNQSTLMSVSAEKDNSTITWSGMKKLFQQQFDQIISKNIMKSAGMLKKLNLSSSCRSSILHEIRALRNMEGWVIKMIDASGKPFSGMLEGTSLGFGSYDECLRIRVNNTSGNESFRGQYCMIGFQSQLLQPITQKTPKGKDNIAKYGIPDWMAEPLEKFGSPLETAHLWFGTCVPSTCSKEEVKELASLIAKPFAFDVIVNDCQVDEIKIWSTSATVSVYILLVVAGFCIQGTLLDLIQRSSFKDYLCFNSNSTLAQVIKCFSLYTNVEMWLNSTKENSAVSCFHGIRFFTATWIVMGHTDFSPDKWFSARYSNWWRIDDIYRSKWSAGILGSYRLSVSTFFYISGYLIAYTSWKKLRNRDGKLNVFSFFLHKYWRMTPSHSILIVSFLVMPLLSSGPLWSSSFEAPIRKCENYWWRNILYINNWFPIDEYCLGHTWFLSQLLQFHVIGIFSLILIYKLPVLGTLLGIALAVTSCIVTMIIFIRNNFSILAITYSDGDSNVWDFLNLIYFKPFLHIASYMIGMASYFLVFKYKDITIRPLFRVLGWIIAAVLALFAVYGLYMLTENLAYRAFYIAFRRVAWSLSLMWLTFSCISGSGGIVNRILSWKALVPLGNLSYLVYLIHPLVEIYKKSSLQERVYLSQSEHVMAFLSNTVMAFFLAFVGFIVIEIPFSLLEKIIFRSERPPPEIEMEILPKNFK